MALSTKLAHMEEIVKRKLLTVALLTLALMGCARAKTPQKVTVAMGFIPNVQFAPMYVALEKGYFAQEGIDLELDYGMETDLLQRVGSNQLPFAIASGDQVILARANGLPVKYVANWYKRFPVCIVSLTENGITSPKDLEGKTVGIPAMEGASYIGWMAFVRESGIDASKVSLQVIGYTQVASLTEKRVDAAICYALNEPIQLREAGYDINVLYLDQFTRLVSNGLITNDQMIEKNPKLVQRMVRAFVKGLQDTLQNPDEAFTITRKYIPEMDEQTARLQKAVLQECISYWEGKPVGASAPEAWEESVSLLRTLGLITEPLDPAQLYTNKFIP